MQGDQKILFGFYNGGLWAKIYFEAYKNSQYIWHKNNTEHLYLILGRAELYWKISSWIRDAPDIHMVETHFLLENQWISELPLGVLEKFQPSSALPNIKYKYSVLFLCQMYWLFIYALKYIFL